MNSLSLNTNKIMTSKAKIIETLKNYKSALVSYGVNQIGLFGSYVRDEQNMNSDIDILIDFNPEEENFDNYMAAYDLIESLFKNEKVEITTKNGLSPYIGPMILKEVYYV